MPVCQQIKNTNFQHWYPNAKMISAMHYQRLMTHFFEDSWDRPGGGGGITRILESPTFEKAGVNTSQVFGAISKTETPMFTTLINKVAPHISNLNNSDFFATGISLNSPKKSLCSNSSCQLSLL